MQERQKPINKKKNKSQMRKCSSVANSRSHASNVKCNSITNTSIHQQNNIKHWFDILEGIDAIANKVKQISDQSIKKFVNVRADNQSMNKKRQNHLYPNRSICATTSLLQSYSNSMPQQNPKNRNKESSKNSRYREEIYAKTNGNKRSIQKKLNRKQSRVANMKESNNKAKLRINPKQQYKYKYRDLRQKSKTMQLSNVRLSSKNQKFSTNEEDCNNVNENECRTQCHKVMQQMHELKKINEDLKKKNEQLQNKLKNEQQSRHQQKYRKNKQNQIILKIIDQKNKQEDNRQYKVVGIEQKSLFIEEPISITLKNNKRNLKPGEYANYSDILNSNMDSRVHKQMNKRNKIDNVYANSYNKYNEYYGRDLTKGIRKHVSNVQQYNSNIYPQYQNQNEQIPRHGQAQTNNKYIKYSQLNNINDQGDNKAYNYTFTHSKYRSNKDKSIEAKNRLIDLTKQQSKKQCKNNKNNIQVKQFCIQSNPRVANPSLYTQTNLNLKPHHTITSNQATNNNSSCITSYDVSNTNSYGVKIKKKPTSMLDLQTQFDRLMQISHLERNKNRKRVIWDEMKAIANQLKMMRYFTQYQN